MDAGKRLISDIFNGNRVLEIPFFQRAYVWNEDQWERLLEDMERVSGGSKPHFLGSVILKQKPTDSSGNCGDVRTVIDGQQRLTTLSIFFKVLCLKTGSLAIFDRRFRLDDGTIALKHNHNDVEAFNAVMELTQLDSIERQDNISRAYMYFVEHLNPKKVIIQTVNSLMMFVGIDLGVDEDEQQIFDTINSLGVKLTTAELLKNFFFGRNDIGLYETYWKNVFESDEETKQYWDQEITAGRLKRTFIDLFFFSYLQIKIQDKQLAVTTEDKVLFSKVERLFDSYKRFIKQYCADGTHAILEEIRTYAVLFQNTFDPGVVEAALPAEAGLARINAIIFALETTTLIPYVLFIERNVDDAEKRTELYAFIETYVMRRLVSRATTKNYNQLFTERLIYNQVLSKAQFMAYLESRDERVNYLPADAQLHDGFMNYVLTNKQAAGVLYFIESKIRDRKKHSTQLLGIGKYSLEHLMPKKWRNHWDLPEGEQVAERRDHKLLMLGNLAIITQPLNASIRDSDWATKKPTLKLYADGIETLSAYLALPDWNEETIESRAEALYAKAREVWSIE